MKKCFFILATLVLTLGVSAQDTVSIATKQDLLNFAASVNGGQYGLCARLTADIDLELTPSNGWTTPIGTDAHPYTGMFDGQGHTLSGFCMYVLDNATLYRYEAIGLFGTIQGATIQHLRLTGTEESHFEKAGTGYTCSNKYCGLLCGLMKNATISRCAVSCPLFSNLPQAVSQLCGGEMGTGTQSVIEECSTEGRVRIRRNGQYGGLLGYGYNVRLQDCYSLSEMHLQKDFAARMGGLVGYVNASNNTRSVVVQNCYFAGQVSDDRLSSGATNAETAYLGAVSGMFNGGYSYLQNVYYLTGSAEEVMGEHKNYATQQTAMAVDSAALTNGTLALYLGDNFIQGEAYPVLRNCVYTNSPDTAVAPADTIVPQDTITYRLSGFVRTAAGQPIQGVAVTDGIQVVVTDSIGRYTMPHNPVAEFIYLTVPAGYELPLDATGSPLIYQRLTRRTGNDTYNFTLTAQADGGAADSSHVMIITGDPQVLNNYDAWRFRHETIEDMKALKASYPEGTRFYGVCVGDIVWDWYNGFPTQKAAFEATGFPHFMTIGNHDHDCTAAQQPSNSAQDSVAAHYFKQYFGPTYYSFNRGAIHYVVLDNVLYEGHNGTKDYSAGLTSTQMSWLQQDLALVAAGTPIVLFCHIPTDRCTGFNTVYSAMNKGNVMQHIFSGHTHTNINSTLGSRLLEHTIGAAEGAFWCSDWCSDGSPNGYMVCEARGPKGLREWYYKGTGYERDYQMRTYPVGSIDAGNSKQQAVLANIWGYDENGSVTCYENGTAHVMRQFTGIDPKIYDVMLDEGDKRPNYPGSDGGTLASKNPGAVATNHLFYYTPTSATAELEVEYTDRFGHTWRQPVQRNMMVATFGEQEGEWRYTQDFNHLPSYPNQLTSTGLAKGTWVAGHTPEGWYASAVGKGFNYLRINTGSQTESALYSYGAGNPSTANANDTDRALGSLCDANNPTICYGVILENNTGAVINGLDISYTGEVWRVGTYAKAKETLSFSYMVNPPCTQLRDRQMWLNQVATTPFDSLNFTTPARITAKDDAVTREALDGHNAQNQTRVSATLPVSLQPHETILLCWTDTDDANGDDQALAIDDLSVVVRLTTATHDVSAMVPEARKVLRDGEIRIRRGDTTYTLMGQIIQ